MGEILGSLRPKLGVVEAGETYTRTQARRGLCALGIRFLF